MITIRQTFILEYKLSKLIIIVILASVLSSCFQAIEITVTSVPQGASFSYDSVEYITPAVIKIEDSDPFVIILTKPAYTPKKINVLPDEIKDELHVNLVAERNMIEVISFPKAQIEYKGVTFDTPIDLYLENEDVVSFTLSKESYVSIEESIPRLELRGQHRYSLERVEHHEFMEDIEKALREKDNAELMNLIQPITHLFAPDSTALIDYYWGASDELWELNLFFSRYIEKLIEQERWDDIIFINKVSGYGFIEFGRGSKSIYFYAIDAKDPKLLTKLLELGIPLNMSNSDIGYPVLEVFRCIERDSSECLRVLLEYGADPNIRFYDSGKIDGDSLSTYPIFEARNNPVARDLLLDYGARTDLTRTVRFLDTIDGKSVFRIQRFTLQEDNGNLVMNGEEEIQEL